MSDFRVEYDVRLDRFRDVETGMFISGKVFGSITHAAYVIMAFAKASIKASKTKSPVGRPPHTRGRGGRNLRTAIRYFADKPKQVAIVGPVQSVVGQSGRAHEFGGAYLGEHFDPRPFMEPALKKNAHRFGEYFSGSLGG